MMLMGPEPIRLTAATLVLYICVASWSASSKLALLITSNQEVTLFISAYQGGSDSAYPNNCGNGAIKWSIYLSMPGQFT